MRDALVARGRGLRGGFERAEPFPHLVLDGFLPPAAFGALAEAFPPASMAGWKRRDYAEQSARLGQLQRRDFEGVAPSLRAFLLQLNGMAFLDFLEAATGLVGLVPDAHFRGAGLSCTLPGGHLALHVDFNRDRKRALDRVLTVLFYVHRHWEPDWGGELELHPVVPGAPRLLSPLPNRLVVMRNADDHWHGHPKPLACPHGCSRNVVSAYYYQAPPRTDDDAVARSAIFRT